MRALLDAVDEREQVSLLFLRDRVQNEAYAVALQRRVDGALGWAHATDDVLRRCLQQLGHEAGAKATRRWAMRQLLGISTALADGSRRLRYLLVPTVGTVP